MDYKKIFVYATRWQWHAQCKAIAEARYGAVRENLPPEGGRIVDTIIINPPDGAWADYCYCFYVKA